MLPSRLRGDGSLGEIVSTSELMSAPVQPVYHPPPPPLQPPSPISHAADARPDGSAVTSDPGGERARGGSRGGPRAPKSISHLFLITAWTADVPLMTPGQIVLSPPVDGPPAVLVGVGGVFGVEVRVWPPSVPPRRLLLLLESG